MKRVFSILLCIVTILSFSACSKAKEKVDIPAIPPERGTVSGKTFHSKYTDIKFTAPSDTWMFAKDEELASSCNIEAEKFANTDFPTLLQENATVYEFIAQSDSDQIAVLAGIENPKLSAVSSTYSARDFVTNSLDSFVETLELGGSSYELTSVETVTLCGHEYAKRSLIVQTDTESAVQTYYARSMGDYLCIIVTAHTGDTTVEQVEALFS